MLYEMHIRPFFAKHLCDSCIVFEAFVEKLYACFIELDVVRYVEDIQSCLGVMLDRKFVVKLN